MTTKKQSGLFASIGRLHAGTKLLIAIVVMICVYFISPGEFWSQTHFMTCWDSFVLTMLLLHLASFFTFSSAEIRQKCKEQDEPGSVIFLLVLICTVASLAAVFLLLTGKPDYYQVIIALAGMLLSWMLIHTIFAFRYAHLYYSNDKDNKQVHAEGLEFPEDEKPDYLDFAYFSFVLGMTFQVSDVQITSKRLRRLSLMHGLISFLFNTFIVALTINTIAGLKEK